ncbi:MAG: SIMPL domain-containing protein [Microscillaceae bacterium]|nr:SIMPL domain-containing protein [Microscillaceae bacterium]MDW8460007.1 SIMPL domain-containing protein [Cytophagales bacterium]
MKTPNFFLIAYSFLYLSVFILYLPQYTFAQAKGNTYEEEPVQQQSFRSNQIYQAQVVSKSSVERGSGIAQAKAINNDFVELEVNVLYNASPDNLVALFNVVQVGETAAEADRLANERIKNFTTELQKIGIKPENIFIDMISLLPIYEVEVEKKLFSKSYNEVPKGFEIQKNIHILFEDEQKLNTILTLAASQEIYEIIKVEYNINDSKKIYNQMQEEALALITAKMEKFKKLGINFSPNHRVLAEETGVAYPHDRYKSYQVAGASSVDAAKRRNAPVTRIRKPITYYYNRISENGYDIVINPKVLAPVVQFTYHLKVRLPIEKVEKPSKEYWLITPSGEVKTIPNK